MSSVRQPLTSEFDIRVYESAQEVVPIILKLVKPRSVVDVGCGRGIWLSVFEQQGVKEVLGIDGPWIEKAALQISKRKFQRHDLTKPLVAEKVYDCAICLEVAEHLPESAADVLVSSLIKLSQVVYFSAAIPFQGGERHVNEQWQSYWVEKFAAHNYVAIDCVRPLIWENKKVNWWYRQNSLVYVKRSYLKKLPKLKSRPNSNGCEAYRENSPSDWGISRGILNQVQDSSPFEMVYHDSVLDVVHPELYVKLADYRVMPASWMVKKLVKKWWYWLSSLRN